MGASPVKPIYFFHIPKTAGRFFYVNTASLVRYDLIKNNISPKKYLNCFGHISVKPIDTIDMTSIILLREPVARTISHYLFIYGYQLTDDIEYDKKRFFDFLEENPNAGIINYQTKFISYDGEDRVIDIFDQNLPKSVNNLDYSRAKNRIEKINYVIDSKDINYEITNKIINKMYDNFNIKNPYPKIEAYYEDIINPNSAKLFNSLTDYEKKKVEEFMPYDVELYKTTKFIKSID